MTNDDPAHRARGGALLPFEADMVCAVSDAEPRVFIIKVAGEVLAVDLLSADDATAEVVLTAL